MDKSDRHDDATLRETERLPADEERAEERVDGPADESLSPENVLLEAEALEAARGEGEAPEERKDPRLERMRIPEELLDQLEEFSAAAGRDRSDVVADALGDYFEAHRGELDALLTKE